MKKRRFCLYALLSVVILAMITVPASMETAGNSHLHDGIIFGMSRDEVIAQEIRNGITETADDWIIAEPGSGLVMAMPDNTVSYCGYDMFIVYFFSDDRMIAVAYDASAVDDQPKAYADVAASLSAEFGDPAVLTPADTVTYMNMLAPGRYREENFTDGNTWRTDDLTVVQFWFDNGSAFTVMYTQNQ